MPEYLLLLLNSIFINNFVLVKFLGLCPVFGVSKQLKSAVGLSLATIFVLTTSCVLSFIVFKYLLVPLNITWLQIIVFIFLIAALVQASEQFMQAYTPILHRALGIYLPLITTNCAVLGVNLLNIQNNTNLIDTFIYSLGTALGFALVLIGFSAIREHLDGADIPSVFKGSSIAMITMGIIAISFMGF